MTGINKEWKLEEDKIKDTVSLLMADDWEQARQNVYEILELLKRMLHQTIEENQEADATDVQKSLLRLSEAVIKAIDLKDTVQLADLIGIDLMELLN